MEQYKHKQTGFIAKKEDKENWYNLYHNNNFRYEMPNEFIENTTDWEPIPENKMKVMKVDSLGHTVIDGWKNIPALIITNPTPETRSILKAIEGKKNEYYVGTDFIDLLESDSNIPAFWAQKTKPFDNSVKILIIPIEEVTE